MKNIFAVDLPRDFYYMVSQMPEDVQKAIYLRIGEAVVNKEWECAVDIKFNVEDINFIAYSFYKAAKPITKPFKDSGLEKIFKPFQKTYLEVNKGVDVKAAYRVSTAGDLIMAKYINESKDFLYSEVDNHIFGADFKFANLESTITDQKIENLVFKNLHETPKINITKSEFRALVSHKERQYDIVDLANNHILDSGENGIQLTFDALKEYGIGFIGAYESEEASKQIFTRNIGDVKVGFINHTFGVNGHKFPTGKEWLVNLTAFHASDNPDISKIISQIKQVKAECELVFVVLHWGLEHELFPQPAQRGWAQAFADAGADVVIGHHPHVIQPFELLTTADSKKVPVFYSVGNLTPPGGSPHDALSYIANFTVARQADGKALITELAATPTVFVEQRGDVTRALLIPLGRLNRLDLDEGTRKYVDEINDTAKVIFGDEYLEDGLEKMQVMN